MKNVSAAYKTAIRSPSRILGAKIIVQGTTTLTITDDNIETIEVDNAILASENFAIGGGIASPISISLSNHDNKYDNINFEDKMIKLYFMIQLADGKWEEIFYNDFWIEEYKETGKSIKLEGFDKLAMDILDSKYSSELVFPAKVNAIVADMEKTLGIQFGYNFKNSTYSFNDLMIPQKPQGSFRQVLTDVATIAGGFLVCLSGLVDIYVLNDTDVEITNYNSYKTTVSNSFSNITGVVVNGYEVGDSTGNVLNQEIALLNGIGEGYLEAIAVNTLHYYKATQYIGYNAEWQGDFAMEVCDKIKVYDEKDVAHLSIVTNNKIRYCGGLKATTQAKISKKAIENKTAQEQYVETQTQENNMGMYTYTNETAVQVGSNVSTEICTLEYETSSSSNLLLFVTIQINATATVECKFYVDNILCALRPKTNVVNFSTLSFNYAITKVQANEKHKLSVRLISSTTITIDANQVQVALFGQKVIGGVSPYMPTVKPAWEQGKTMQYGRYGAHCVVYNNKIYVDGGYSSDYVSSMEIYDIVTNTWSSGASGGQRAETKAVLHGGKMYVVGGSASGGNTLSSLKIYDIATNTWSVGANMPTSRTLLGMCVLNGKIYVCGGDNRRGTLYDKLEIYDIATNTWSSGANMPVAATRCYCATINGSIYVFGINGNKVWLKYNVTTNTWEQLKPSSATEAWFNGAWTYNGNIYLLIGSEIFKYNNVLTKCNELPEGRGGQMAIAVNRDKWYFAGGSKDGSSYCDLMDILTVGEQQEIQKMIAIDLEGNTIYKRDNGTYTNVFETGCTLESVGEAEGNKIEIVSSNGVLQDRITVHLVLRKVGDIKDGIKDNVFTQRIGKTVLNGSENWVYFNTYGEALRFDLNIGAKNAGVVISDKFTVGAISSPSIECINIHYSTGNFQIQILKSKLTQYNFVDGTTSTYIPSFKSWLQANNVTVLYELATPVTTPQLTELKKFENGTVQVNTAIQPTITVRDIN
ncbi:Kelch motif-containing protein [Hathewaya proteolytica DSM 3090]|uniref:Kelch motif-containing protein n=1 Tax=Hathewaya proteolytica DSM 3090 TaxID=1121331 RepID=A0A1M6RYZ0_9CLOT|nr:kelch repeat-containing protein [Hathewaya proteolytica]SHK37686.1 Kelch motif-containing protein [Hathewaya proteolytica DSM 3090]